MRVSRLFSILLHIFLAGFDKKWQSALVKTKTYFIENKDTGATTELKASNLREARMFATRDLGWNRVAVKSTKTLCEVLKPLALIGSFFITACSFPTGQTVPQAPTVDRVSVLQSISTEEMLQIAADCMIEEGYDESDMHEALSAAIRR